MSRINITKPQKEAIAEIMAAYWGGHMQTGYSKHPPTDIPQVISLWVKMGPNQPALDYQIHADGSIKVNGVEWDGRSPR